MDIMRYAVVSGWITLLFVVVAINGCGENDDTPAQFVRAVNDKELWEVYFDKPPENLSVTGAKEYALSGTTLRITGAKCTTDIVVFWQGGQKTFDYPCGKGEIVRGEPVRITVGNSNPRNDGPPPATRVVEIEPPPGAIIPPNQEFKLRLDEGVEAVTVNGAAAQGAGLNWTAKPALAEGANVQLRISWTNRDGTAGTQLVGPYTVRGE